MGVINQFRSVIQWQNPDPNHIFIKFTDRGEEIKNASKLILQPGQACVITDKGKIKEVLTTSGIYDLKADNKPFITTLKKLLSLREGSEHIIGIWFFRQADIINMRWGTRVPIAYTDPVYTFPILLSAFGNYSIRITQPQNFFEKIVVGKELLTASDLKEIFLSRITQNITDYLANAQFSYVKIDSHLNEIAKEITQKTQHIFEDLGFQVLDFRIEGTRFDTETLDRIAKISDVQAEILAAKLAGIHYTEHQKIQAMRDAANNPHNVTGVLMQLQTFANQKNNVTNQITTEQLTEKLQNLKKLFELDLISESEFKTKKQDLLKNI